MQVRSKDSSGMTEFDAHRALLVRRDIFAPLCVSSTRSLRDALTGGDWDPDLVDGVVTFLGLGAFVMAVVVNARPKKRPDASARREVP